MYISSLSANGYKLAQLVTKLFNIVNAIKFNIAIRVSGF